MSERNDLTPTESALLGAVLVDQGGNCSTPICCGEKMLDNGGCSDGCCDDYKCATCGKRIRVEWPA